MIDVLADDVSSVVAQILSAGGELAPDAEPGGGRMSGVLHVIGLPHTSLTDEFSWCAYTGKVRRFPVMMSAQGYKTVTYHAGEGERRDSWRDGEYVQLFSEEARAERFPPGRIPAFTREMFDEFNRAATSAIRERIQPGDVVCLVGGLAQESIARAFAATNRVIEFAVGYEGVMNETFRCFESYAWMHTVYGHQHGAGSADGRCYDAVIPNYYDTGEFPLRPDRPGEYLLYMARLEARKGIHAAVAVAEALNVPLLVAGSGTPPPSKQVTYLGVVGPSERARLLCGARALIQPTTYVEPFGGVVAEALLCGTPVLTTDWGAFTETVRPGVDGFRCRTLRQFVDGWGRIGQMTYSEAAERRAFAQARWSLATVGARYRTWLASISDLDSPRGLATGPGWYA